MPPLTPALPPAARPRLTRLTAPRLYSGVFGERGLSLGEGAWHAGDDALQAPSVAVMMQRQHASLPLLAALASTLLSTLAAMLDSTVRAEGGEGVQ